MLANLPTQLSARDQARYAQATAYDYGRVGDQRPYQVVFPAYGAPKFLQTFHTLEQGLRECSTLCRLKGLPFRLIRWGAKQPCVPCGQRIRDNRLPGLKVTYSRGALEGFPDATPVAEFRPTGEQLVYGPDGEAKVVGQPNYVVSVSPQPTYDPGVPQQRYLDAVRSAQVLAGQLGRRTYLCSSFGAPCSRSPKKWFPVVYVEPGGLVARFPTEVDLGPNAVPGSTNLVTSVTPDEYAELIAESRGATLLGQGA